MKADLTIKSATGAERVTAHVGKGSKRYYTLMEEDYLQLKFTVGEAVLLRLGDYVEIEHVGRYEITAPTSGKSGKAGGYDYDIKLEAQYWKFRNKLMKFLPQTGSNETDWSYTDTIANHCQQLLANMCAQAWERGDDGADHLIAGRKGYLYNGNTDWEIRWDGTVDAQKAVTIDYSGLDIIGGAGAIAEAYECEWWFVENVLWFGRCEYGTGEPVRLEWQKEIVAISDKDSKEEYGTRFYIYGSDRNLASTYRKELVFEATSADGLHFCDDNRPLKGEWFPAELRTYDPSRARRAMLTGKSVSATMEIEAPTVNRGNVRYSPRTILADTAQLGDIEAGFWRLYMEDMRLTVAVEERTRNCASGLILYLTLRGRLPDGSEWVQNSAQGYPIKMVPMYIDVRPDNIDLDLTEPLSDVTMEYDLRANITTYGVLKCSLATYGKGLTISDKYPATGAQGLTVDVLDTATGDVARTIEGVVFNPDWATGDPLPLQLPGGASIGAMERYRIREINTALVPASYFTSKYTASGKYTDIVTNGVVLTRLQLPETDEEGRPLKGYIDAWDFESEEEAVEKRVEIDDVYPSRVSKITRLSRSDEYYDEQAEQDGSTTLTGWRAWRFEDDLFNQDNPFDADTYMIDDAELQITFQSGLLNGMTFGVAWDPEGRYFEIQRDDTTKLPNELIKPKEGDEFILHGFNIAMLNDLHTDYVEQAERELLRRGREYVERVNMDTTTYKCTISCDVAYAAQADTLDGIYLGIGRSVMLIHPAYFKDGRQSRVIGYEIPLDYAYDNPVYYIGETPSYSRIGAIEDALKGNGSSGSGLTAYGGGQGGGSMTGGGPYVIGQYDSTVPSDTNVYSARRSRVEFAMKSLVQTIKQAWTFLRGLTVGNFVRGYSGAEIDAAGNAEVESLTSRSWFKVYTLIYNRLNALEGDTSFGDVGTISMVSPGSSDGKMVAVMRKRWDGDMTAFQPGDVVYGYVNDLGNSAAKTYGKAWAWVESVDRSDNSLTLVAYPDSEVPGAKNMAVTPEMIITRWGNNVEPNAETAGNPDYSSFIVKRGDGYTNLRQSTFIISCEQGNIMQLMGVRRPILEDGNLGTVLGRIPEGLLPEDVDSMINRDQPYLYARGILVQDIIRIGYKGMTVRTQNYRGEWNEDIAADPDLYYRNTADTYDVVTWRGAMWQNLTTGTREAPSDSSGAWLRMTGSTDEIRGLWRIIPNASQIHLSADGTATPGRVTCEVRQSALDGEHHYSTAQELDAAGVGLWISVDGAEMQPFVMGDSKTIVTTSGIAIMLQDGRLLRTQGDNFDAAGIGSRIVFELRDLSSGERLDMVTVPVVRDGEDGGSVTIVATEIAYAASQEATPNLSTLTFHPATSTGNMPSAVVRYINASGYHIWTRTTVRYSDGNQTVTYTHGRNGVAGVDGAQGPMVYPAGEWDAATQYTATVKACPVVLHNGQYYVLRAGQTSTGENPAEDYATNGDSAAWQLMERMNYVFADILMANFAKLSEAVFYGDYMFSQHGVIYSEDGTGTPSADYQKFTIDDDGQPTDDFVPNYLVNLRTGRLWTNLATLREFDAQNGKLGPFAITSGDMEYTDRTGEYEYKAMRMYPDRMEYSKTSGTATDYGTARAKIGRTTHEPAPVVASVNGGPGNTAVAIKATAERATYCRALEGVGSVATSGAVQGYGLRVIDAGSGSRTYLDYTSDKVLIKSSRGGEVVLPSLAVIRGQLGISAATPFMVTITIVAHSDCTIPAVVKGRDSSVADLNSSTYPKVVYTGNCTLQTSVALSGGSRMEAVLFFDGTDYLAYY